MAFLAPGESVCPEARASTSRRSVDSCSSRELSSACRRQWQPTDIRGETVQLPPKARRRLGGIVADGNLGAQAWVVSTLAELLPLGARHGGE